MKRIIVALTFIALLASCEKEIPLDAEYTEPKITLNSVFRKDSVFEVHLSRSLSVIDNGTLDDITGATVELLDASGNLIETLNEDGNGFYSSNSVGVIGVDYTMRASEANYETVTASDRISPAATISFHDTATLNNIDQDVFEIEFNLTEASNSEGYYRVRVIEEYVDQGTGQSYFYDLSFSPVDGRFQNNSSDNYEREAYLTASSLALSNGPLKLWAYTNTSNLQPGSSIIVKVESLTKVGYEYLLSSQRAWETQGNFFAQPVLVRSNVENGFGVFMGLSESNLSINF